MNDSQQHYVDLYAQKRFLFSGSEDEEIIIIPQYETPEAGDLWPIDLLQETA
jgi:hypothetical protein